jgi:hypothetical protein
MKIKSRLGTQAAQAEEKEEREREREKNTHGPPK